MHAGNRHVTARLALFYPLVDHRAHVLDLDGIHAHA
jgi:hypothetical protein